MIQHSLQKSTSTDQENSMTRNQCVLVVGAGLAGCEAAYFLANQGMRVILAECKRQQRNPAQKMDWFAELVCTNSLKSTGETSAHGILKFEMEQLGSLTLKSAYQARVPAGDALAVDREAFGKIITNELTNHANITILDIEVTDPIALAKQHNCDFTIIASGPLTTSSLESWLVANLGKEDLYFYDAIAPVVDAEGLDYSKLYFKDRYADERNPQNPDGEQEIVKGDYLNAPFNKEEYERFIEELVKAEKVPAKNFEEARFFESCLPIDLMAERGPHTARFSCMKPVGLETPSGKRAYAVVQLRKENLLGEAFNIVGFQTRLTYKEQLRIFRMIPGLENANFLHLGSVHRNTFLNSKKILNPSLQSKEFPRLYFAGQITGVEGYTESAAMGLYVAWQILRQVQGLPAMNWPIETAVGALINYLMTSERPAPSNINRGLFPPLGEEHYPAGKKKMAKDRKAELIASRARAAAVEFLKQNAQAQK
jgi:methylenetetrahydrofolate--tRNA-(uracil-5-)-methyltransferase